MIKKISKNVSTYYKNAFKFNLLKLKNWKKIFKCFYFYSIVTIVFVTF